MAEGIIYQAPSSMKKAMLTLITGLVVFGLLFVLIFIYKGLLIVDNGEAAILIAKTGDPLPSGEIIVRNSDQQGIQLEPLGEGWYWKNPYSWDWVIVNQVEIKKGFVGVKVRNYGKDLPAGRVIAGDGEKGILSETLRPGIYLINTLAESVIVRPAVTVPSGHFGVVTLLSGKDPKNPNQFLVEEGERGVQKKTLTPSTYYAHPYIQKIVPVNGRSHRFDMMGANIIMFPSRDGFDITMEGTIEWHIDRERAAEVYVRLVDGRPGPDSVIECIVEKIILPYARSFSRISGSNYLAREIMEGEARQRFQTKFEEGLQEVCAKQGIVIESALIRDILPPDKIRTPIKLREIAIQDRDKILRQIVRETEQKKLKMEEEKHKRETLTKQAELNVNVGLTSANTEKRVAITKASEHLDVATRELKAAEDEAAALIFQKTAEAKIKRLDNAAEAAGLRYSVEAFGDGHTYVLYLMNKKIAPAIGYILSNTEGPFVDIFKRATEGAKK